MHAAVGKPVRADSGYRSSAHDVAIYKEPGNTPRKSQRCSGGAVDIKVSGMTGMQSAKAADAYRYHIAINVGGDFAYIDVRDSWQR